MKSGLLWYDNSKDVLSAKINRARARYKEKYGIPVDTICINPTDAERDPAQFETYKMLLEDEGVKLATVKTVQPGYIWMGLATQKINEHSELPIDADFDGIEPQPTEPTEPDGLEDADEIREPYDRIEREPWDPYRYE